MMKLQRWVWLCVGLAGCFTSPPGTAESQGTSGGSSSSGTVFSEEGVSTNVDPSTTTSDAASTSSSGLGSSSSSGEGTSTSTGAQGCPGAGVCFPPSPPQWDGPVVVLMDQGEGMGPMCPPGAQEVWRAGTDPAARCDCSQCSGDIGCDVEFGVGGNGSCSANEAATSGCQPFSTEESGQFWMSFALQVSAGAACESPAPAEPRFRERAIGCQPNAPEPCEDGVCLLGRVCISQMGDHAVCPPGFPNRSLLQTSVTGSDLSCDTCGCGDEASGLFCTEAIVGLYGSADCSGTPSAAPQPYSDSAECGPYEGASFVLIEEVGSIDVQVPQADCSSDRAFEDASGDLVEAGPRTVCCSG
ncbi:MAG: hypothetical protein KUG77_12670 [Nannocystaceae bacterium]|nr:hypothetical protein [Nannocystaceae bacterium]